MNQENVHFDYCKYALLTVLYFNVLSANERKIEREKEKKSRKKRKRKRKGHIPGHLLHPAVQFLFLQMWAGSSESSPQSLSKSQRHRMGMHLPLLQENSVSLLHARLSKRNKKTQYIQYIQWNAEIRKIAGSVSRPSDFGHLGCSVRSVLKS